MQLPIRRLKSILTMSPITHDTIELADLERQILEDKSEETEHRDRPRVVAVLHVERSNGLFDQQIVLANLCLRRTQDHDNQCISADRKMSHKRDPILRKR